LFQIINKINNFFLIFSQIFFLNYVLKYNFIIGLCLVLPLCLYNLYILIKSLFFIKKQNVDVSQFSNMFSKVYKMYKDGKLNNILDEIYNSGGKNDNK